MSIFVLCPESPIRAEGESSIQKRLLNADAQILHQ